MVAPWMTIAAMARPLPFSPRDLIWERATKPRISGTSGIAQTIDMTNATMASGLVFCDCCGYQPGCPGWPYGG